MYALGSPPTHGHRTLVVEAIRHGRGSMERDLSVPELLSRSPLSLEGSADAPRVNGAFRAARDAEPDRIFFGSVDRAERLSGSPMLRAMMELDVDGERHLPHNRERAIPRRGRAPQRRKWEAEGDVGWHGEVQVAGREFEGERERDIARLESGHDQRDRDIATLELELGLREGRGEDGKRGHRGEAAWVSGTDAHGRYNSVMERGKQTRATGSWVERRDDEDREGDAVMASDFESSLFTLQKRRDAQCIKTQVGLEQV